MSIARFSRWKQDWRLRALMVLLVLITAVGNGLALLPMPAVAGQLVAGSLEPDCDQPGMATEQMHHQQQQSMDCCSGDTGLCAFHCMAPLLGSLFQIRTESPVSSLATAAIPALIIRPSRPPLRPPRA
ncbi:MAG: hypothetical protein P8Y64_09370 [Gammaproteobacteria bacterium]|jgi:hypothetical protein